MATILAGTLLLNSSGVSLLLTGAITLALFIETVGIVVYWRDRKPNRVWLNGLLPLAAITGLVVAAYLTNVEVTQSDAFCGLVGKCNAVQQSSFARLFGILPIGVLGMAGYTAILLVLVIGRNRNARLSTQGQRILRAMVLFGVVFSIYLTFLEPFVIGATCVWCLTSAVIMLLLLWLTTPAPQISQRRRLHAS